MPFVQVLNTAAVYGQYNDSIHQQLEGIVGNEGVSSSRSVRDHHGKDESYHTCMPAEAVVFPTHVCHVGEILRLCNQNRIPVVPFGTGTGLEGGVGAMKVCFIGVHRIRTCSISWKLALNTFKYPRLSLVLLVCPFIWCFCCCLRE